MFKKIAFVACTCLTLLAALISCAAAIDYTTKVVPYFNHAPTRLIALRLMEVFVFPILALTCIYFSARFKTLKIYLFFLVFSTSMAAHNIQQARYDQTHIPTFKEVQKTIPDRNTYRYQGLLTK